MAKRIECIFVNRPTNNNNKREQNNHRLLSPGTIWNFSVCSFVLTYFVLVLSEAC